MEEGPSERVGPGLEEVNPTLSEITRAEFESLKAEIRTEVREIKDDVNRARDKVELYVNSYFEWKGRAKLMMYVIPGLTGVIGFLLAWILHS